MLLPYKIFAYPMAAMLLAACGVLPVKENASNSASSTNTSSNARLSKPNARLDPNCFVTAEEFAQMGAPFEVDLWDRIRDGYQLTSHQSHSRITAEMLWYARHPDYMLRVTERANRYMFHIVEALEARGMPMEIALLPIVESAFDPFAYSHGRASGMWQIIPGTGKMLGLKQNWWYDGRRDVVASTEAALTYLERLHKRFDGDWLLALAAYNSGGGNVSKAIRKNIARGKPTDFWSLDLPKETQAYVPRLLALSQLFAAPDKHNIVLNSIPNAPYFARVNVGSQIDLAQAAELAEIDMGILYHLNPAFNRWATDPQGPHELLIPLDRAEVFSQRLEEIAAHERVTWDRYTIKSGDSLSTIARRYNVSVNSLKSINKLKSNQIRAGKTLMVPVAAKAGEHYSHSVEARISKRYKAVDQKHAGEQLDYTVRSGDSLWSISRKHKVSVAKLAKWNSMAPGDPIRPGQKLKLWTISAAPKNEVTSASLPVLDNRDATLVKKVSYRVRNGDSLARIAQKFSLRVNDIVQWNKLNKAKYLQPGQSLTLFVDVTHSRGS